MKIAFCYPTMFKPQCGGVERVTDTLAREFIRHGHKVIYVHNIYNADLDDFEYPAPMFFFPDGLDNSAKNIKFFHELINREKIDIVINQCGAFRDSWLYCNLEGTAAKSISVVHFNPAMNYNHLWGEIYPLKNNSIIEKLKRIARVLLYSKLKRDYLKRLRIHYKKLEKVTNEIILLSSGFRKEMSWLNPELKFNIIPNPLPFNVDKNQYDKENIILWVGRMDYKQKRPDRMLKIWKKIQRKLPDWKLIFIGGGEYLEKLQKKAKRLNRIEFTGYTDPIPYYRKAKLLCMTSSFEGFGMVLLEAMAFGCVPVVFDSFSAVRDIIVHTRQKICPFKTNEFCEAIINLVFEHKLYEKIQIESWEKVADLESDKIYEKWVEIIQK